MTSFSIFRQHRKFKKNLSKVLNTLVNIKENAPFHIIFSNGISKAPSWSKGLTKMASIDFTNMATDYFFFCRNSLSLIRHVICIQKEHNIWPTLDRL